MSAKSDAAFNKAFNTVKNKDDAKHRVAMAKVKLMRDRANAIEAAANEASSKAFDAAMSAGRKAAWNAERR